MGKYLDIIRKVLSQEVVMCNIKSSSTHSLFQSFSKVKIFKKWVKLEGQGLRIKNNKNQGKVLSYEILMSNIKVRTLSVQKLLAMFNVSERRT